MFPGDEDVEDGVPGQPSASRARKKTDLMPTIPSSRDGSRSRHRSPGTKSQSMSHLNLLSSTPRPPPRKSPQVMAPNLGSRAAALSRSTGTLHKQNAQQQDAATAQQQQLRKTRATQSMSHLAPKAPIAPPRMTRAERLRQKARQIALANKEKAENGKCTFDVVIYYIGCLLYTSLIYSRSVFEFSSAPARLSCIILLNIRYTS